MKSLRDFKKISPEIDTSGCAYVSFWIRPKRYVPPSFIDIKLCCDDEGFADFLTLGIAQGMNGSHWHPFLFEIPDTLRDLPIRSIACWVEDHPTNRDNYFDIENIVAHNNRNATRFSIT